jgi:ribosomal protein S18 acetylase RimI-like enzyme
MAVSIVVIPPGDDMSRFISVPFRLYRNDPNWVPQLISQEKVFFDPNKNPAFNNCETIFFLALRDGVPCGRIAGVISREFNEKNSANTGRFGWFEADAKDAAELLFDQVESWLTARKMTRVVGPMGFSDNDATGFLVQGHDEEPTIAGSYSPPWYAGFVEERGYTRDVDYVEYRITVPGEIPEKVQRMAELISRRTSVKVFSERSRKRLADLWAPQIFDVLNSSYTELYGTTLLSRDEIGFYIRSYLGHVDPGFVKIAVDGQKVVGFIIAMPSLTKAFRKARGRLFPLGFFHILREMRNSKVLDFYLAGILREYQGKGVDLLMSYEMAKSALARGITHAESNRELETNTRIQAQWKFYDKRLHRRSRVYWKSLVDGDSN